MQKPPPLSNLGQSLVDSLRLSSDEAHLENLKKEKDRSHYRRAYWQSYNKRKKRVFGMLSLQEHEALKQRAEESGRSLWGQLWAEACAYRHKQPLPTLVQAEQQRQLIAELRRIGNNINQLAKLGHIEARKIGSLNAPSNDRVGLEVLRQFSRLEKIVCRFHKGMAVTASSDEDEHHDY